MRIRPSFSKSLSVSAAALAALAVVGCGSGTLLGPNSVGTTPSAIRGIIHGGPNPVVGARVVIYATTTAGYGAAATALQEANQTGTSLHQDTDGQGNFAFAGGFTCPAGQYAYVVAYGGNTGANANNPNSVLMTALGPCSSLYTGTTYTGPTIFINELSTVASAYALSNFITVSGNALSAGNNTNNYAVNVSSDVANSGATGCVSNSYYGTGTCPATKAAGMAHAFANASALVNTNTGQVAATTTTGATIPAQLINTLGNILQACVNSTGGGTSTSTGLPATTTTTAGGTTHDGTVCGKLFAFTSYTSNGNTTDAATPGTPFFPGNTLDAIKNLAKRPTASASTFNTSCSSGSTGTTTATSCLFGLAPAMGFYNIALSAAPADWMLGISYAKGAFQTAANGVTCASSPTTNGTLYPFMVATDINDNVVILNGDASTSTCYNLLTIGFDGTTVAGNGFDNANALPIWVSTDAFGHAIVPVHGTAENGIRIFGATDSGVPLVANIAGVANTANNFPYYSGVDQNDGIYLANQPAANTTTNNFGYLSVSGTESHAAPAYTVNASPTPNSTAKLNVVNVDINGVGFASTSSSSGSSVTRALVMAAPTATSLGPLTGSTSNGITTVTDNSGNVWQVQNPQGTFANGNTTTPVSTVSANIPVFKQTYTVTGGVATLSAPVQVIALTPGAVKPQNGTIDGNNVIWFADLQGSTVTVGANSTINTSFLHGYDTVNNYDTHNLYGCKPNGATSTTCGSNPGDSNYPTSAYLLYGTRGIAIDAAGSIWIANGTLGTVNEIIGLAAPTYPLHIHNGTTNKP